MIIRPYRFTGGGTTFGNASRYFDGSSYVALFNVQTVLGDSSDWSVSWWQKSDNPASVEIIWGVADVPRFYYRQSDRRLGVGTQTATFGSASHTTDVWEHFVVTFEGSDSLDAVIYKNGSFVQTLTSFSQADLPDITIYAGGQGVGTGEFSGYLSELSFYTKVLSSGEAATLAAFTDVTDSQVARYFGATDTVENLANLGTYDGTNNGSTYSTDGPFDP